MKFDKNMFMAILDVIFCGVFVAVIGVVASEMHSAGILWWLLLPFFAYLIASCGWQR